MQRNCSSCFSTAGSTLEPAKFPEMESCRAYWSMKDCCLSFRFREAASSSSWPISPSRLFFSFSGISGLRI